MGKTKQGLSAHGYAKRCGLSGSYVCRLVRDGRIPLMKNGRIDPTAADEARERNIAPRINPYDTTPVDLADVERRPDAWLTLSS